MDITGHEKVKTLLRDTITLLCKNGLQFHDKFTVEAVIGVTLDDKNVLLLSINELVRSERPVVNDAADLTDDNKDAYKRDGSQHHHKRWRKKRKNHDRRQSVDSDDRDTLEDGHEQRESTTSDTENISTDAATRDRSTEPPLKQRRSHSESQEMVDRNVVIKSEQNMNEEDDILFVKKEMLSEQSSSKIFVPFNTQQATNYPPLDDPLTSTGFEEDASLWSQPGTSGQAQGDMMMDPQNPQVCPVCGKHIQSKTSLKRHLDGHKGNYHYHCPICQKGFMASTNLRGHMFIHTGVREHKCTLCDKDFRYKRSLKDHMALAHDVQT